MLYFDHAATTPPFDEVVDTVAATMREYFANPSSLHRQGQLANMLIQASREQIANLVGVHANEIVFTSGGTESNALAIQGVAKQFAGRGKHVIVSAIEHPSVEAQFRILAENGFDVTVLPVDQRGIVSVQSVLDAVREDTILVSIMHVNSEVGSVQPVAAIGQALRAYPKIVFHVDAVQSVGKLPLDIHSAAIDLLSISAHKFRGPRGVGALIVREGISLAPFIVGGNQEAGLRAGTLNTPAIAGMAKALRLSMEQVEVARRHVQGLKQRLTQSLNDVSEELGIQITSGESDVYSSPYLFHFTAAGLKAQVILHALEQEEIIVSSRSACSSRDERPSATLLAMGKTREQALAGIRISFGAMHTVHDVDRLAKTIRVVITKLRNEAEQL